MKNFIYQFFPHYQPPLIAPNSKVTIPKKIITVNADNKKRLR